MKRKNNAVPPTIGMVNNNCNKKRGLPKNEQNQKSNKTMLNFFTVTSIHKSNKANNNKPANKIKQKKLTEQYKILQKANQKKLNENFNKINVEKYKILTEENVLQLSNSLYKNVVEKFKSSFVDLNLTFKKDKYKNRFAYIESEFDLFLKENLHSILVKFFLANNDDLIYIPKSFIENYLSENKKDDLKNYLKLFSGFNDEKKINLPYECINQNEALYFYPELCSSLISYIKKFKRVKKQKKSQKGLVIYTSNDSIMEVYKKLEMFFDYLDYKIIRLDELESNKLAKFKETSEATKSHRIGSVSESIITKINILENMINETKWKMFVDIYLTQLETQPSSQENKKSNVDTMNKVNIENTFDKNSLEYKGYSNIKSGIFDFILEKKTLIMIVDNFIPEDDNNKNYFNNIASKISTSKCPIAILTSNLKPFADYEKSSEYFSFVQVESEGFRMKNSFVYLFSMIIFLHLFLEDLTKDVPSKESIEAKLDENFKRFCEENRIYQRVILLTIGIIIDSEFKFEKTLHFITEEINSVRELDWDKKLKAIEERVFKKKEENDSFVDVNNEIAPLFIDFEEASYNDYVKGRLRKISEKKFQSHKKNKSDVPDVNLENYLIASLYNKSSVNLACEAEDKDVITVDESIKKRNREDRHFIFYYLRTHPLINRSEIILYNELLHELYNVLPIEKLNLLFNLRNKRSTSKGYFDKSQDHIQKVNILNKLISCSREEMERYFECHEIENYILYDNEDNRIVLNQNNFFGYFSDYYQIEQFKQKQNINNDSDDMSDYNDITSSIDEFSYDN